jgi:dTDP-4-amino-4,6-dideoxygalactose transaminase
MFYLIMPSLEDRQGLIDHLKRLGILSVFHYQPLHLSEMGRRFGGKEGDCPITETISERLVRLPFFYSLTETDQARVIEGVSSFQPRADVDDWRSKRPAVANGRS